MASSSDAGAITRQSQLKVARSGTSDEPSGRSSAAKPSRGLTRVESRLKGRKAVVLQHVKEGLRTNAARRAQERVSTRPVASAEASDAATVAWRESRDTRARAGGESPGETDRLSGIVEAEEEDLGVLQGASRGHGQLRCAVRVRPGCELALLTRPDRQEGARGCQRIGSARASGAGRATDRSWRGR